MPEHDPTQGAGAAGRERPGLPTQEHPLLRGPVLPTLVKLSIPNIIALTTQSLVVIAETSYIGLIGTEALAAMALVFPLIMLTQMTSSGAMGGGVSSATARALGSGNSARAEAVAVHAVVIAVAAGLLFMAFFLSLGPWLLALLGGRGQVLAEAVAYAQMFFAGVLAIWLFNTLVSIVRGTGNMRLSASTTISVALLQILLGGILSLGLGPFPRLGIRGVALGQILAFLVGSSFLLWLLMSARSRVRLSFNTGRLDWELFRDILKVGAVACLSPLQSVLTVLIMSGLVARLGTEALAGYGIGVRLEFLLVPIAFAIGVASVPMVGMAIGAGNVARARETAWTAGILSGIIVGAVGVAAVLFPDLWVSLFTDSEAVRASTRTYLGLAGLGFPLMGFGLAIYFAAQGSGRILGPVLAGTARLAVIAGGGYLLVAMGAGPWAYFALVATAMIVYGIAMGVALWATPWQRN
jgi:putative MATE family efflux protein